MDAVFELGDGLEMIVVHEFTFERKDRHLRGLVRQAYAAQVAALLENGCTEDDALHPRDSIGTRKEPGILTESDENPTDHHLFLVRNLTGSKRKDRPLEVLGMRVTAELYVPQFGKILLDNFPPLVPGAYAHEMHDIEYSAIRNQEHRHDRLATGRTGMSLYQILLNFSKHLSKSPEEFRAMVTDGKGISRQLLGNEGYLRAGPEGETVLWTPPLSARFRKDYLIANPTEFYAKFRAGNGNVMPEQASKWLLVKQHIGENYCDLERLEVLGMRLEDLPSVVKTNEAIERVSAQYGGLVWTPIPMGKAA